MRNPVCWVERTEDGVKREIRVARVGGQQVLRWQAKRADEEKWVYDFEPTAGEWDYLANKMEARYQRRASTHEELELVRRLRAAALARGGPGVGPA